MMKRDALTKDSGVGAWLLWGLYLALRYYVAFTLLRYGFAKVMGAQFTVLDSQLDAPMGRVSGFWLTWYYFGYSPVYSAMVAWVQIAGALLVCFRRTALIGVFALLPVMVNIVAIDLWVIGWRWDEGALRNAVYVLIALLLILAFHAREIVDFFWRQGEAFFSPGRWTRLAIAAQILVVCAIVG
jgi:hypothetical protein